ncbi:phosphoadenylyl-sulfate reductase [Sphingosinicella rhizophila]|uniref:Adenosine 5'-phosphosulfate reductase n=1 Tax=Sphingosinicella rhizophila TaxID=3050082 RepID=A0ABU3Q2U4_9SPHN|nr:phosphoadenylyl-sulfate reductase [Sphingosinicella sp. GR2756]MDT9597394.1 phosphoadenylyl-sulfate reductase [Sphingosinicella sp. GR2756]
MPLDTGQDQDRLAALQILEGASPAERLQALRDAVPGRIVFTTSFGIEDQALTHIIFSEKLKIDVVTLDTGRLFPSTYQVWAETEDKYARRIRAFYPNQDDVAAMVADAGINGFYHSKEARLSCCHVRKVEPLGRALAGAEAWVTGLRADQSGNRAAIDFASWDDERQLIKIAPLFDWTRERVADFCTEHAVPINELHAKGFLSIGCAPCTRALQPGEPERAGRWWWETEDAKECGLHVGADGKLVRRKAA